MRMIDAYTHTVFGNYFRFDGRMSRAEFWWFTLCNFLIIFAFIILAGITIWTHTLTTAFRLRNHATNAGNRETTIIKSRNGVR